MGSSGQKILRATALVMGLTAAGKATGLLKDVLIARQFGTSAAMDAFLVALTIVTLMFIWVRNPIQVTLIPIFTRDLTARGERAAWEGASVVMNTCVVLLLILAAIGWVVAPYFVSVVGLGFDEETQMLSAKLTRVIIVTVIFLGLAQIFSGFFYAHQRFGWPGMISTVDHLVAIPSIVLLTPFLGIQGLAIAVVLGTMAQAVVQIPIVWKNRAHLRPRIDFRHPTLVRMASMSVPMFIGTGGDELAKITDRMFASLLPAGSLSALAYGHRLTYGTLVLFVTSMTTVLFPFLSRTAGLQNYDDLGRKLFRSLRTLFWIILPLSIGVMLLNEPLIRLVYQRGAFDETSARLTSQAMWFQAMGLSAYALSNVLSYAFYSLENTKTPVTLGLVRLAIKVPLCWVLVRPMAHAGLALAESVSWIAKALLMLFCFPKEPRQSEYRKTFRSFAVTAGVTGAMAVVVLLARPYLHQLFEIGGSFLATLTSLGVAAVLAGATYLVVSFLLQPTELRDLYRFVRAGFIRS